MASWNAEVDASQKRPLWRKAVSLVGWFLLLTPSVWFFYVSMETEGQVSSGAVLLSMIMAVVAWFPKYRWVILALISLFFVGVLVQYLNNPIINAIVYLKGQESEISWSEAVYQWRFYSLLVVVFVLGDFLADLGLVGTLRRVWVGVSERFEKFVLERAASMEALSDD